MKLLFFILKLLNSLIPKSNNKILFISRPDFSDNTLHMYRYIKRQKTNKQLSWLIYDKNIYDLLLQKGYKNIFYLKSISGIWEYLRSKIIITSSSSLWQVKSPFQKQFDLWHGIPLKTVLCMGEKHISPKRQAGNITRRFATSNLEKAQLAASFDYNAIRISVTGHPRTDALFNKEKKLSQLLGMDVSKYNNVIFYMPTYRQGYRDKQEGTTFNVENIFRMKEYDHQKFLEFLERNKILFLLKLHPYEEKLYEDTALGDNIKWITNTFLVEHDLDTYDIFYEVDTLITDYSSIYFDILLLDKKIIFLPLDLDIYERNRGFQLEPYDFWAPGKKIFDQENLQKEILENDSTEEKEHRKLIKDIMFKYQDDQSAKRIYDIIFK